MIALKVRTRQSRIEIAEAARTRVYAGEHELRVDRTTYQTEDYIQQVLAFRVERGVPLRVEKLVALYTSRDRAISEPLESAGRSVGRYPRFDEALASHRRAWDELWNVCDVRVPGRDLSHGKPHPEIFLTAAEELGIPPPACFVVEDAVSGVGAVRAGGMAASGSRVPTTRTCWPAGADLVVTSLDDVDVPGLVQGRLTRSD